MSSPADIHYDSLPVNVTLNDLISMSLFDEYIYKTPKREITLPELGLTINYYSKISRKYVIASFVERLRQTSDENYNINDFMNDFKVGDNVTLNYKVKNDEYYIHGTITFIDAPNGTVKIHNNNALFIPRTHHFDYYTMYFINSCLVNIHEINKSLIKKD